MNILHIDSSILGEHSISRQLSAAIAARLQTAAPGATVRYRDLAAQPLPQFTAAPGADDAAALAAALEQVLAADVIVIGAPMYNFGITVQLKSWFDAIARANVTFKYTETGPVGLLTGKKVYVGLSRGGLHRDSAHDSQVPYLNTMFGFLGMTDVQYVYSEGMGMGPEAVAKAQAQADAEINAILV